MQGGVIGDGRSRKGVRPPLTDEQLLNAERFRSLTWDERIRRQKLRRERKLGKAK